MFNLKYVRILRLEVLSLTSTNEKLLLELSHGKTSLNVKNIFSEMNIMRCEWWPPGGPVCSDRGWEDKKHDPLTLHSCLAPPLRKVNETGTFHHVFYLVISRFLKEIFSKPSFYRVKGYKLIFIASLLWHSKQKA